MKERKYPKSIMPNLKQIQNFCHRYRDKKFDNNLMINVRKMIKDHLYDPEKRYKDDKFFFVKFIFFVELNDAGHRRRERR